jgi:hypothetical protein
VPFAVAAHPSLTLGRTLRHVVPLPFARVTLCCGAPLDAGATVDECQRAIDERIRECSDRAPARG